MYYETKFMKGLLPDHYKCEPTKGGVHCHSEIGIDENDPEQWDYTFKAVKQKFGKRFMEVFHQTCTNHVKFTVFLRPIEWEFEDWAEKAMNEAWLKGYDSEGNEYEGTGIYVDGAVLEITNIE